MTDLKPPEMHRPGERIPPPRICVFGRSGIGKTSLLHTLPGRGLVVDVPVAEGGDWVLADYADRIKSTTIVAWDEIDPVCEWLMFGEHDVQWVAVDSATGMKQLAIRKTQREVDVSLSKDPHVITDREWGKIGTLQVALYHKMNMLKIPVIWLAQERSHRFTDDNGDEYKAVGPDVSPMALSALIPSMMYVGRLFAAYNIDGQFERRLRLGTHKNYVTKARAISSTIQVPAVVRNPSLNDITKFLLGKKVKLDEAPDEDDIEMIELDDDEE